MIDDKKEKLLFIVSSILFCLTSFGFFLFFLTQQNIPNQDYLSLYKTEFASADNKLLFEAIGKDLNNRLIRADTSLVKVLHPRLDIPGNSNEFRQLAINFLKNYPDENAIKAIAYASAQRKEVWAFDLFSNYAVINGTPSLFDELKLYAKPNTKYENLRMLKQHLTKLDLAVFNKLLANAFLGDLNEAYSLSAQLPVLSDGQQKLKLLIEMLILYDLETFASDQILEQFLSLDSQFTLFVIDRVLDLSIANKKPLLFTKHFKYALARKIVISPTHLSNYKILNTNAWSADSEQSPIDAKKTYIAQYIEEKKDVRALLAWLVEAYQENNDIRMLRLLAYFSIQIAQTYEIESLLNKDKESHENWSLFYNSILSDKVLTMAKFDSVFHPLADAYIYLNKARVEVLNNRNSQAITDMNKAIQRFRLISMDMEQQKNSVYALIWSDFLALASRIHQTAGNKQKANKDFLMLDLVLPEHSQLFYADKLVPNDFFLTESKGDIE